MVKSHGRREDRTDGREKPAITDEGRTQMHITKHKFKIVETAMKSAKLVIAALVASSASMVQAADEYRELEKGPLSAASHWVG